jgi:hypothetical protein
LQVIPEGFITTTNSLNGTTPCLTEFSGGLGAMCLELTATLQLNGYVLPYPTFPTFVDCGYPSNAAVVNDLGEGCMTEIPESSSTMQITYYVMIGGPNQLVPTSVGGRSAVTVVFTLPNETTITRVANISVTSTGKTTTTYSTTAVVYG